MDIDLGLLFVSIIGLSALSPAASVYPMLSSTGLTLVQKLLQLSHLLPAFPGCRLSALNQHWYNTEFFVNNATATKVTSRGLA